MSMTHEEKPWDFSNVLDLITTLSHRDSYHAAAPCSELATSLPAISSFEAVARTDFQDTQGKTTPIGLGDFAKVWQFLGSPLDSPGPAVLPVPSSTSPTLQQRLPGRLEYTSDGGVYPSSARKQTRGIAWRDETTGGDLTDVAPSKSEDDEESRLTKKQRYKRNKRLKQKIIAAETGQKATSDYESEADNTDIRHGPASKASVHNMKDLGSPAYRYNLRDRDISGRAVTAPLDTSPQTPTQKSTSQLIHEATAALSAAQANTENTLPVTIPSGPRGSKVVPPVDKKTRHKSEPIAVPVISTSTLANGDSKTQWPVSNSMSAHATSLLPSSVQPSPNSAAKVQSTAPTPRMGIQQTPTRVSRHAITPKVVRSGDDRHWALLLKLIQDFYEDRGSLIRPANLTSHSNDPRGIHVFVDASNIFIGFHDQLKRARNIPAHIRVPQVAMSFEALSLLMERRRPIAKRVLAGSTPHVPAFEVAREVGYECNILDKVFKARELTERQKYFQDYDHKGRRRSAQHGGANGNASAGSGSENTTAGPTHAPEKFVEQGVDEILHLKILESVVDVDEPTTIVLATGDAAQAEYSQGFMRMVERALRKGWRVELVSWSKNISQMYKKASFRDLWGDKFRIVELDDYAEELLDM